MYLALNNLQRLICHKINQTKPNQVLKSGRRVHFLYDVITLTPHVLLLHTYACIYIFTQGVIKSIYIKKYTHT